MLERGAERNQAPQRSWAFQKTATDGRQGCARAVDMWGARYLSSRLCRGSRQTKGAPATGSRAWGPGMCVLDDLFLPGDYR